ILRNYTIPGGSTICFDQTQNTSMKRDDNERAPTGLSGLLTDHICYTFFFIESSKDSGHRCPKSLKTMVF
ncbi:MAG TPA: hypothetical protein VKN36_06435, partial [Eudoraea sp.]|nr:hypothetical protein [Eudoraea sp.]